MALKWQSDVPSSCQHCGNGIFASFSDIRTRTGQWAILCDNCVVNLTSGKYGNGMGQRYVRDSSGEYIKVEE